MLLEAYLRGCGTFREELLKQTILTEQLISLANTVINTNNDIKRKTIISRELLSMNIAPYFQITINPK